MNTLFVNDWDNLFWTGEHIWMASEGSGLLLVFLSDSNKSGLSHEKVRIIRSVMAVLQSEIKKIYGARS